MQLTDEMHAMRNKGMSYSQIAEKVGTTKSTVMRAFIGRSDRTGGRRTTKNVTMIAPAPEKRAGRSLGEFRATYDKATIIPAKIKAGLKTIGASGWEYEVAFAKLAGVTLSDLGAFRDQFAAYVVSLREGRRAWAGSGKTAQEMRAML